MDWISQLNDALDYMERNLAGRIDYNEAARLACCSTYHFQRMFPYMAGVPLSEYIRRRRMTLAAFDLQNGGKVLEVALRYGYESPTSFNRAFQSVHGVSPSAAQKEGASLKAFQRISFKITIKGDVEMEYRIETKEAFRIVGASTPMSNDIEVNMQEIPKLWGRVAQENMIPRLCELMNSEPKGVLGVSACVQGDDQWAYFIAVASTLPAPEGMEEYTVPATTWAVFPGTGAMPAAIQEIEKRAMTEWLPSSSYEYNDAPDIEVYMNPDPANSVFEVWVPIRKKA